MRWKGSRQSTNFEDRRGMSSGGKLALGGVGGIVVLLIGLFLGGDPQQLLQQLQPMGTQTSGPVEISAEETELTEFVRVILASTEDVWGTIYASAGEDFRPATLVLYRDGTQTGGCGMGASAYGPFYCPADEKVYIDLDFNDELRDRFGATGEFAMAYVLAHEVGHHIQKLTGAMDRVQAARQQLSETEYNRVQVMLELQADFYAGVWAHHANKQSEVHLEYDDIRDGMDAAAAVGDDRLQMQAQGRVVPEAFTHGTSEQRAYWFKKGYDTGDVNQGDTFSDPSLQ
ncbi:KPN_02809 family neutral zinc metallopeptidase [Parapedobacter lycopersici]|uniref:KPN_02809 family neutral zinc metallopeptidase n=1 Tax=Parapedobacter lycopersici TaxID=1864939 RepID=UPI00214D26D2|nr:neutral zinc metallopeptidase [Parapedobacter lycopersici]